MTRWSPFLVVLFPALAAAQSTTRVSVSSAGVEANARSFVASVSADGRFVAFESDASSLVAGDTNGFRDVFVHDVATGTTTLESVGLGSAPANGASLYATISPDGRYVTFQSRAENLVSPDGNGSWDLFLRDRVLGTTVRLSAGLAAGGFPSGAPTGFSEDGRYVAFEGGPTRHVFVHDQALGTTVRVSVNADGVPQPALLPAISADGRYVAFASDSAECVAEDENGTSDVFVHDRDADGDGVFDEPGAIANVLVSVSSAGVQGDRGSYGPSISADGRFVSFYGDSSTFDPGAQGLGALIYVHDRDADGDGLFDEEGAFATVAVSVNDAGTLADARSAHATISADGRFVAFMTTATNLVPMDVNGAPDVVVHDRDADEDGVFDEAGAIRTSLVSVDSAGVPGDRQSDVWFHPSMSPDGRFVAFGSESTNLVATDLNGVPDIFLRDRAEESGPRVRIVEPSDGSERGGDLVTVRGVLFPRLEDVRLEIGGTLASVVEATSTRLRAFTPSGTGGLASVRVSGPTGGSEIADAYEYRPAAVAVRFGNVNVGFGTRTDVLTVEGSAGDDLRVVRVGVGLPFRVELASSPRRADSRYAVYAWIGAPTESTVRVLPHEVGSIAFPMPLVPGAPQPRAVFNTFGHPGRLGAPTVPTDDAPATLIDRPAGLSRPMTITFQGLIEDDGSAIPERVSVTNAVVLKIE